MDLKAAYISSFSILSSKQPNKVDEADREWIVQDYPVNFSGTLGIQDLSVTL